MTDVTRVNLLRRARRVVLAALAVAVVVPAGAAESTALDAYLQDLKTWSAKFSQDVRDARNERRGTGGGRLIIVRPGKFRWESGLSSASEPAQLMIADGKNLWFLDYDLEQATVKPLEEALPQSPAMLLAGGAGLRTAFKVSVDGRRDGFDWVRVEPTEAESDFSEALFGFRGRELARLVIVDKLGQRSTLSFSDVRRNAPVDPQLVQFKLPEGADLIGTPVKP